MLLLSDPNFWSKWAKKANIDVDAALDAKNEHLIVSHPRSRRKRFEENYKASESGEEENGSEDGEGTILRASLISVILVVIEIHFLFNENCLRLEFVPFSK